MELEEKQALLLKYLPRKKGIRLLIPDLSWDEVDWPLMGFVAPLLSKVTFVNLGDLDSADSYDGAILRYTGALAMEATTLISSAALVIKPGGTLVIDGVVKNVKAAKISRKATTAAVRGLVHIQTIQEIVQFDDIFIGRSPE